MNCKMRYLINYISEEGGFGTIKLNLRYPISKQGIRVSALRAIKKEIGVPAIISNVILLSPGRKIRRR